VRHVVATIDGRPREAGDRYTLSNQTPRPAAAASEMGQDRTGAPEKGSYLQALFYRIKARHGPKKAIMAVVAAILTAIYHMLKNGTMYQDLGPDHFDRHSVDKQKHRLVKRLADLGYAVELKPITA
jgi:transposase